MDVLDVGWVFVNVDDSVGVVDQTGDQSLQVHQVIANVGGASIVDVANLSCWVSRNVNSSIS